MAQQRAEAVRIAERKAAIGDQESAERLPWLRCRAGQCCAHRTAVNTRDDMALKALIDARDLLVTCPPIVDSSPHGVLGCAACDYPLTGGHREDLPDHADWVSPAYSVNAGRRCPYVLTLDALQRAIAILEAEDA